MHSFQLCYLPIDTINKIKKKIANGFRLMPHLNINNDSLGLFHGQFKSIYPLSLSKAMYFTNEGDMANK